MNFRRRPAHRAAVPLDALRGTRQEPAAPEDDAAGREENERRVARVWRRWANCPGARMAPRPGSWCCAAWRAKGVPEVAQALSMTTGQIKVHLRWARANLRRLLGDDS